MGEAARRAKARAHAYARRDTDRRWHSGSKGGSARPFAPRQTSNTIAAVDGGQAAEDGGYIMALQWSAEQRRSSLLVFDAQALQQGPVV